MNTKQSGADPESHLLPGPSDHYGPFHQTFPITFNGSLVRRIKICSDGPPKTPQTSMTQDFLKRNPPLLFVDFHVVSNLVVGIFFNL